MEAFSVTESSAAERVHLTPITEAPAQEAVVLKGEEGAYVIPVAAAAPAALEGNLLKAALTDVTVDGSQYVLAQPEGKEIGFYKATIGSTIAAGKGYIEHSDASVKGFLFDGEGNGATAVTSPFKTEEEGEQPIYNLAGQRLQKVQRGINIVNGKKVISK